MEEGSRAIRFLLFTGNPSFKKDLTKRISRLRFGYEILHFDQFQNLDNVISEYDIGLFEDDIILEYESRDLLNIIHDFAAAKSLIYLFTDFKKKLPLAIHESQSVIRIVSKSMKRDEFSFLIETGEHQILHKPRELNRLTEKYLEAIIAIQNLLPGNFPDSHKLTQILDQLGNVTESCRVTLFENRYDFQEKLLMSQRNEWVNAGVTSQINNPLFNLLPYQPNFERWSETLTKGDYIVGNVDEFPNSEKPFLLAFQIRKVLIIPISIKGNFWGFVMFSICRNRELWSDREILLIKSLISPILSFFELRLKERTKSEYDERLRRIFESSNVGLVLASREGLLKSYNPAFLEMIGYTDTELQNLSFKAFTHPDDLNKELPLMDDLLNGKISSYLIEKRYIKKGGAAIWVKNNVSAYSNEKGRPDALISIIENISKEKEAEKALQESEDRYRKLSDLSLEGIIIHKNGIAIDCNDRILEMTAYSRDELIGRDIVDFLADEQSKLTIVNKLKANDIQPFEVLGLTKSGSKIAVELENRVVTNNDGVFRVTAVRDITERKKREQEIRKLNTAINQSPSSIVITNRKGEIEYVNKAFCDTSGFSAEEVLGQNPRILKTENHTRAYYRNLWDTISSGKIWEGDFRNKTKDGTIFWERAVISPIFNDKNEITHYLAIKENTTKERNAQKAFKVSEEKHRVISELTNDFVYSAILDKAKLVLKWTSGSLVKLSGFTLGEMKKKNLGWYDIVLEEDFQSILIPGLKKLKREKIIDLEYRIKTKNGNIKWMLDKLQQIERHEEDPNVEVIGAIQDITQRKEAIIELSQSKKYLDSIIDNLPIGLQIFDEKGFSVRINEKQRNLLGLKDLNVGKGIFNILAESLTKNVDSSKIYRQVYENKNTVNHEIELNFDKNNDWETRTGSITINEIIFPILKEDGDVHSVISLSNDISKRVNAEKALKASEMHQKILLKIIPDLIFVFTQDGYFKDIYTEDAEGLLIPNEEYRGKFYSEFFPGELGDKFFHYLKLAIETGTMQSYNYEIEINDATFYYETRLRVSGENEVIAIIRDITDSIKSEHALKESEEKFRELAERSQDALVLFSVTNEILFVSPNLTSILGVTVSEYIMSPLKILRLIHHDDKEWVIPQLNDYRKGKLEKLDLQFRVIIKKRELKWIWYRESCIYDENNIPARYAAVITDISQNKLAEEELKGAKDEAEKANRSKSAFLANISHEIRTPMNAVLGFSDLLHSQIQDPVLKGYLNSIKSSGETLLNLLNDILDLSKIEAEKMKINTTVVNLFSVFDEIKHIFSLKALEKGLDYSFTIDKNIPKSLLLDELRFKQIMLNLVDNAIKFTEKGRITISANKIESIKKRKGNIDLSVIVKDTGIGIPAHLQESIFDAFRQQDDQDKKKFQGTGLGLAITKRLVELLKGEIKLTSNPKEGSKFEIILRDIEVSKQGSEAGIQKNKLIRFEKSALKDKTILLIDDEKTNRELIKEVVYHSQSEIIEGESIQMLNYSAKRKIDLVIMEFNESDSLALDLAIINKNEFLKNAPRIGITSKSETDERLSRYFNAVLTKPIQLTQLVEIVSSIFKVDRKDDSSSDFESKDKEVIKKVIGILEGELLENWEDTLKTSSFVVIEEFAQSLKNVGNKYDFKSLQSFSDVLVMHAKNFDIDNMQKVLKSFPTLITDLKKTI